MKLILKNFKCYLDKIFEFPDQGTIFLNGLSGVGKSTILSAISFVLYNECKHPVNWNAKSCSVQFIFKDFDILRKNGRQKVVLNYKNQEYQGDVAQQIINQYFGTNFQMTSY